MKPSDLKYLFAFFMPITGYIAVHNSGIWSWVTVIFAFIILPAFELILGTNSENEPSDDSRENQIYFDILLFLNLPLVYILLWQGFNNLGAENSIIETIGKIASMGVVLGTAGINVAHELGHKTNLLSQISAKLLLVPAMYTHFTIQHNRGHHLNVGTPIDPATSLKNENLYTFWVRSVRDTYKQAWQIAKKDKVSWTDMHTNLILTFLYPTVIYFIWDMKISIFALIIAIISFLLLETINYIEHYGLQRKKLPSGRYEVVKLQHSWNSNHTLGRIFLYELTRHADHHYKANKKYQTLAHYDISPQLPYGYPASLLLSLVPLVWFKVMNPIVDKYNNETKAQLSH
jgi:alkane 1-monooxygenase